MSTSYWLDEPSQPIPARSLSGRPDVIVIGGGVTGCACAHALAAGGLKVLLHEARTIAGGASGRNAGFALRGAALSYDAARASLGPERAPLLWELSERALRRMAELAGEDFRATGSVRLAVDDAERAALEAEHDALREDGFAVEPAARLSAPLRRVYSGGIVHPGDGLLHPVRWVRRLAARAASAGAEILEGSAMESADLDAPAVVVATDALIPDLLPELARAISPVRGQMLVTEQLPRMLFERPHYARYGFDYWVQLRDRRLVAGGKRDESLDTEYTDVEETTAPIQERLDAFVGALVGSSTRVTHRWAGIWGQTPDLLPLVGPVPGRKGVWVAGAYSGHGNVLGFACGELVAQAILGERPAELDLFDPARAILEL
jgi:gamma-glutamylputrescine oxidase